MNMNTSSTSFRRWLPALVGIGASLLISSFSVAYVTLAAPQRAVTVPSTVGFEGRLADSSGQPLDDGNYTVTFSLYGQAAGGDPIWAEEHQGPHTVTTHNGLYSVQLGSVNPENNSLQPSDFDGPRWLGVKVGTEAEMAPRIPISSVPFALNAAQASGLQGRNVSADIPSDGQALVWDASSSEWLPGTIEVPDNFQYPRRASGFHINDTVVSGDPIVYYLTTQQAFGYMSYQYPSVANGDTFTTSFMLRAGAYTLHWLGQKDINRGKINWYIDNALQISNQDWYASPQQWNVVQSGSITVVGDGHHVLKGVISGKNASSSGYYMALNEWWIAPASD
jgi:hypothetical protein